MTHDANECFRVATAVLRSVGTECNKFTCGSKRDNKMPLEVSESQLEFLWRFHGHSLGSLFNLFINQTISLVINW